MKNVKLTIVTMFAAISLFMPQVVQAASISYAYFSLSGWNGPLYIDFKANCKMGKEIFVASTAGYVVYDGNNSLSNWRVFTKMQPNQQYTVTLACLDGVDAFSGMPYGYGWQYNVRYANGKVSAVRVWTGWGYFD